MPSATAVEQRADLRALLGDIARLPDDQRSALVLAEVGDLSLSEIAAVIEVPTAKVKALVHQARSRLIADRDARETPCEAVREQLSTARGGRAAPRPAAAPPGALRPAAAPTRRPWPTSAPSSRWRSRCCPAPASRTRSSAPWAAVAAAPRPRSLSPRRCRAHGRRDDRRSGRHRASGRSSRSARRWPPVRAAARPSSGRFQQYAERPACSDLRRAGDPLGRPGRRAPRLCRHGARRQRPGDDASARSTASAREGRPRAAARPPPSAVPASARTTASSPSGVARWRAAEAKRERAADKQTRVVAREQAKRDRAVAKEQRTAERQNRKAAGPVPRQLRLRAGPPRRPRAPPTAAPRSQSPRQRGQASEGRLPPRSLCSSPS